ncbi:hypothetical protein Droror1_Dr00024338, partial [Drosera rotundifolia]
SSGLGESGRYLFQAGCGRSCEPPSGGWFQAFSVAAYKPYFDVDSSDVLERIKESLFPFKGSFTEMISNNPDLYFL